MLTSASHQPHFLLTLGIDLEMPYVPISKPRKTRSSRSHLILMVFINIAGLLL